MKSINEESNPLTQDKNAIQALIRDIPSHIMLWSMALLSLYIVQNQDSVWIQLICLVIGITMMLLTLYSLIKHIENVTAFMESKFNNKFKNRKVALVFSSLLSILPIFSFFFIVNLASFRYSFEFVQHIN